MVIEIGSHSLTTSNTITIADFGASHLLVMLIIMLLNIHIQENDPVGDPASGKICNADIEAETATTITVNVGISNDEPDELTPGLPGYTDGIYYGI